MNESEDQGGGEESFAHKSGAKVSERYDAFAASARFAALNEQQKRRTWNAISFFTRYSANYFGLAPEDWTSHSLEECCGG